ncbi:MAG TPA: hypothetical protein VIZ18_12335 [Ktedonobacteraceae bacterium]
MKQFQTIEKLDTGILYALELASSISVLLLAFGLIASMANVLTKGSVLSDSAVMRQIWAWTQCIAIDASVAGTIIRAFHYHHEGEKVKTWLYGLLSVLLLFTAAIVSNIEAVQQTLNVTLDSAYSHVFVSIEVLTWIRSISVVLIIVAHSMRHVQIARTPQEQPPAQPQETQPPQLVISPELLETLRVLLSQPQTTVTEEQPARTLLLTEGQQETDNGERVKAYLAEHPHAHLREIAAALSISVTTVSKWRTRIQGEGEQKTARKRKK